METLRNAATARRMSYGMSKWLREEARHASKPTSGNKVLDNLEDLRQSLVGGEGTVPSKSDGHSNRQRDFNALVREDPTHDFASSKTFFNIMMQLSGGNRLIAAMQATDQEDYFVKRHGNPGTGTNTQKVIGVRMVELMDLGNPDDSGDHLENALFGVEAAFKAKAALNDKLRGTAAQDFGEIASGSVESLIELQKTWIGVAVDWVASAAEFRNGDISQVPLLQPMSISDQPQDPSEAVIYPFAA